MSTKKISAGDTLTVGDLTDDHLGAVIEVGPTDGVTYRFRLNRIERDGRRILTMRSAEGGIKCAYLDTPVTVITPPPVVQPDAPTVPGQCIRIEGDDDWLGILIDSEDVIAPFCDADGYWWSWDEILAERAKGRQIIVSDPPRWPDETPEAPERIEVGEWPDDDTHLRAWKWIERDGYPWWWDAQVGLWRSDYMTSGRRCPFSGPWARGERVE